MSLPRSRKNISAHTPSTECFPHSSLSQGVSAGFCGADDRFAHHIAPLQPRVGDQRAAKGRQGEKVNSQEAVRGSQNKGIPCVSICLDGEIVGKYPLNLGELWRLKDDDDDFI